ncbi:MAG: thioredoxin domain-containing protein [archaeon]
MEEESHKHDEDDEDEKREHHEHHHHEHHEKKDHHKHHKHHSEKNEVRIDNNPDKKSPWMFATIIVAIIAIILLVMLVSGKGLGESTVSGDVAGETLTGYLNSMTGGGVEYVSNEDLGSLYEITVSYNSQEIPVFITKDAEYFVQAAVPISTQTNTNPQTQEPVDVPKSDKPKAELFIWSYCPYGVQAQEPLAEVVSLLGDSADFEGVLYYDGHGAYETQQNKIQACIQEVAKDKYWKYATGFVQTIYPNCGSTRDIECDKTESVKLMKSLGIDDTAVMSCVDDKGEALIAEHASRAQAYGVTGSPSLVINGVKVNTGRTAEAYKAAICEAFNNAPEECETALSSDAATTGAATAGNC